MSTRTARAAIAMTFSAAVLLNLAMLLLAATVQAISLASLNASIGKLLLAYSAPGLALILGLFAKRRSRGRAEPLAFWAAIGICVVWNVVLVWRCVIFGLAALTPSASGGLKDLDDFFETVSKGAAVVTTPITYFFAKPD